MNFLEKTAQLAQKYLAQEKNPPKTIAKNPAETQKSEWLKISDTGEDFEHFFENLETAVMQTPHTGSPVFFNQLFGGKNMPAIAADMLVPVLNNSMYTYKVAGVQINIEKEVLTNLRQKIGWHIGDGMFTPGGSISNMMAMQVARNEADENFVTTGNTKKLIAYTSEDCHYSIKKNAGILGIGTDNVRLIHTLKNGKMCVKDLEKNIQSDIQNGYTPFFVNATAGTTVWGAFDPFVKIRTICDMYSVWMHVDAAWGGGAWLNDQHKTILSGAELADSVTWNPHKMMGIPLIASAVLFPKKNILMKHFSQKADYLFQVEDDVWNPGQSSIQCGRRNDALKVWAAWKFFGHEGFSDRVEKLYQLQQHAIDIIKKNENFTLLHDPEYLNICFSVNGKNSEIICKKLYEQGLAQVGFGTKNGTSFIRLITVNPDLSKKDIDMLFTNILSVS